MTRYIKDVLLLADPLQIKTDQILVEQPLGYQALVSTFGPGEFHGEVNLLLPSEVQGYASFLPIGSVDPKLEEWRVFANCNDGSALAYKSSCELLVGLIPPQCENENDVICLDVADDWLPLLLDDRLIPNGLEVPYFIPRKAFEAYSEHLLLMEGNKAEEAHNRCSASFYNREWTLLRASSNQYQTLTKLGKQYVGVLTLATMAPELVSGALDSRISVCAKRSVSIQLMEEIISVLEHLGWLFDDISLTGHQA